MKLNLNAVLLFISGVSDFVAAKANNAGVRPPDAHKGRHYMSPGPSSHIKGNKPLLRTNTRHEM